MSRADRRWYRSFYVVTAATYAAMAVAHRTIDSGLSSSIWPGDDVWAALYLLCAGLTAVTAVTLRKSTVGPRLWVRRAGLIVTPLVLVARSTAYIVTHGTDGAVGALFSAWSAFVVAWAAVLLRHLPAQLDEWEELRAEFLRLRAEIYRGPPHSS